jgi:rare lipoprotein A
MSVRVATWYGPGFYGRRTACGLRLGRTTPGVAHRRLPCGTSVTLYYRGRFATVPVIDRGPHVPGVTWDLTAATARNLGFRRTGKIRSLP